jgi:hypothetical protein
MCCDLTSASSRDSFANAFSGKDSLIAAGADHDSIDLVGVSDNNKGSNYGSSAMREIDSEHARAVRIHRVGAAGRRVREVGDYNAVNCDGIGLCEIAIPIKMRNGYADLWSERAGVAQFLSSDRESIVASDHTVVTDWVILRMCKGRDKKGGD